MPDVILSLPHWIGDFSQMAYRLYRESEFQKIEEETHLQSESLPIVPPHSTSGVRV